ncbi:hypothetical protein Stube_26650 [Streptomyces tubercidicus]|uniref:Uncharacterized protein n=1 Tax=Streptomyces tubercidicus TaxID=47759 RepID=A0A640URK8_9ACTN|nr:hypothetical protein Stube_26650 [Streptomyces tubercidicus]
MSSQQEITTTVYVALNGSRYHKAKDCVGGFGRYNSARALTSSLDEALQDGRTPCEMCFASSSEGPT